MYVCNRQQSSEKTENTERENTNTRANKIEFEIKKTLFDKTALGPLHRGYLSLCRVFTAAVLCVPALRVPLVHSQVHDK